MKDKNSEKIVAIIPAYNEEGRVSEVVKAAVSSGIFERVIVVDDGSTDATAKEAEREGAEVIRKEKNEGKASAIQTALNSVEADIYVFLDADLYGLKKHHLKKLLEPLNDKNVGMVLGRLAKGRLATNLSHSITPNITGQRAIRGMLAKKLPDLSSYGFAVEVFLNDFCRQSGYKLVYVDLEGVSQYLKEEKHGFLSGFVMRLEMYLDILKYLIRKIFKTPGFQK